MNIKYIVNESAHLIPQVEGPIKVTEKSHPFCAMKYSREPLDLKEFGYIEEEYFIQGQANVYDEDGEDNIHLYKEGVNYKNRIIIRRPENSKKFSGRVYMDILNATQRYDIEDLWHRTYLWCMENGHAYVGITSKPVNVMSLKNFDYERYKSLNWSNGESIPFPTVSNSDTIPGTEEGLVWDIISQTGNLIRIRGINNIIGNNTRCDAEHSFDGWETKELYLCGQSQSGSYLNTYISYFDSIISIGSGRIFDGYMNIVGAFVQRSLRQRNYVGPLKLQLRHMHPCTLPFICFSSEADLTLFKMFLDRDDLLDVSIENKNEIGNRCRYYEISETPHTDIICPILTSLDEIKKTGARLPSLSDNLVNSINDIHTEYYICGLLEKLHKWAMAAQAPEVVTPLVRENGHLKKDRFGNTIGGLRTPYVDVPIARYIASNPDDPEGICGKMKYFSKEEAENIYGNKSNYIIKFSMQTEEQVRQGWISETDCYKMIEWCKKAADKVFGVN